MLRSLRAFALVFLGMILFALAPLGRAQLGNSGTIEGVVKDPTGGAIPNATVEIANPVSGFTRTATTVTSWSFHRSMA